MKQTNKEIQILRGMAILAVVGIHTLSIGLTNTLSLSFGNLTYQILHTLLQFAVPTFIFISALMVTYTLNGSNLRLLPFYKKKLIKVGLPYILWTLIYVLPQMAKGWIPVNRLWSPNSWVYWLIYGKGYDHLYYLSVTLQLYLIAPIAVWLLNGFSRLFKKYTLLILLPLAVIGQICIYLINKHYISRFFGAQATLVIWYFIIIVIAMWAGANYDVFTKWLKKHVLGLCCLLAIISIVYILYRLKIIYGLPIHTAGYQAIWYAYVLAMTLCLLLLAIKITATPIGDIFLKLGQYSFGIYLIHPMMTYWLRKCLTLDHAFVLGIILGISMAGMMTLCIWISKFLLTHKYTKILLGAKS